MTLDRKIRVCHIIATAQFGVSAALIIFWSLRAAGLHWAAIFSLSATGVVLLVLAVLIYAFAVFRGVLGERTEAQHPLGGSLYYRLFYVVVPILGGVIVGLDYLFAEGINEAVRGWALGTVLAACIVWLVLDPVVGLVESALPRARRLRAEEAAARRARQGALERSRLRRLHEIRARRKGLHERLAPVLAERAERIVGLLRECAGTPRRAFDQSAAIGLETWRAGGSALMKELFDLVTRRCRDTGREDLPPLLDYWWDGIGDWRAGAVS